MSMSFRSRGFLIRDKAAGDWLCAKTVSNHAGGRQELTWVENVGMATICPQVKLPDGAERVNVFIDTTITEC